MADKCLNCGIEVVSKGTKPTKYCSDRCRKAYKRTQDKKRTEQTDANGQNKEQIEQTDNLRHDKDKLQALAEAARAVNSPNVMLDTQPKPFTGELTKQRQTSQKGFNN